VGWQRPDGTTIFLFKSVFIVETLSLGGGIGEKLAFSVSLKSGYAGAALEAFDIEGEEVIAPAPPAPPEPPEASTLWTWMDISDDDTWSEVDEGAVTGDTQFLESRSPSNPLFVPTWKNNGSFEATREVGLNGLKVLKQNDASLFPIAMSSASGNWNIDLTGSGALYCLVRFPNLRNPGNFPAPQFTVGNPVNPTSVITWVHTNIGGDMVNIQWNLEVAGIVESADGGDVPYGHDSGWMLLRGYFNDVSDNDDSFMYINDTLTITSPANTGSHGISKAPPTLRSDKDLVMHFAEMIIRNEYTVPGDAFDTEMVNYFKAKWDYENA